MKTIEWGSHDFFAKRGGTPDRGRGACKRWLEVKHCFSLII